MESEEKKFPGEAGEDRTSRRHFLAGLAGLTVLTALTAWGCGRNRCSGKVQESVCPTCQGKGRVCNSVTDGRLVPAPGEDCVAASDTTCPYCQGKGYLCNS